MIQLTMEDPNGLLALVHSIQERASDNESHLGNLLVNLHNIEYQLVRIANALEEANRRDHP